MFCSLCRFLAEYIVPSLSRSSFGKHINPQRNIQSSLFRMHQKALFNRRQQRELYERNDRVQSYALFCPDPDEYYAVLNRDDK